ncbi:hypothetical protein CLAVI_000498 [Candidatus Clavichlamydia salmonicola]|uniref:hypothetical protein n=1 Tax=Candidatus Clavichlamydia salmonicola TaxID=469812 RepID=UPI0018917B6A|nr:hypothetical protein [Candidatus Clavichlamydia salmonicola]MBF5050876.1 hypothetical protein [Candidatus Clavichlamydia salmonicola]
MLQINHILNSVGLRAPSSPTEALNNMKKNTLKILGITGSIILGVTGLCADKLCNHCLLCLPELPRSSSTDDHQGNLIRCIPGIATSTLMSIGIVYKLSITFCFSLFKGGPRSSYKKICVSFTQSLFLSSTVLINALMIIACLIENKSKKEQNTTACSLIGLTSALLGAGYTLFAVKDLLFILLSNDLPIPPQAIELIPIIPQEETEIELNSLRSQRLYPSTQIINMLSQLDSLVASILEMSMTSAPDDIHAEDLEIGVLLQQAIVRISCLENILMQSSNLYSPEICEELSNLTSQIYEISHPLRGFHNQSTLAIILSSVHTLTRYFVALHAIEVPANISLSLPQFQSLCPPPEYELMTISSNHLSRNLTSAPLSLEAPPAYAEYPLPQLSSPETTPIHVHPPSTSSDEEMLRIFMQESRV